MMLIYAHLEKLSYHSTRVSRRIFLEVYDSNASEVETTLNKDIQ